MYDRVFAVRTQGVENPGGALNISDSAGNTYLLMKSGAGVTFFGGTGTIGDLPYVTSGGGLVALAAGSSGYVLCCSRIY